MDRQLYRQLEEIVSQLDNETQRLLRNGADYDDLRYAAGHADGVRTALRIMDERAEAENADLL